MDSYRGACLLLPGALPFHGRLDRYSHGQKDEIEKLVEFLEA